MSAGGDHEEPKHPVEEGGYVEDPGGGTGGGSIGDPGVQRRCSIAEHQASGGCRTVGDAGVHGVFCRGPRRPGGIHR